MEYLKYVISDFERINSPDATCETMGYSLIPLVLFFFAFAAGIICTVVFLTKRQAKVTVDVVLRKSLASVLFIITGAFALIIQVILLGYVQTNLHVFSLLYIIIGLCFGMLGDIWLDLKYVYKPGEKRFLNAGFLSFLIGHLFYSAFLFWFSDFYLTSVMVFIAGFIAVAVFTATTEKLLKVKYGEFKKITVIYMGVLGGTLALSGYNAFVIQRTIFIIFFIGMIFFIASDALLAGIYFGNDEKARTSRTSIVLNHALYYTAQYMIALSIFFYV